MRSNFSKTLKYSAIAAIAALPAMGNREANTQPTITAEDRVEECFSYYSGKERDSIDNPEVVVFVGCAAMESCREGKSTTAIITDMIQDGTELVDIAQRSLPTAEDLVGKFDLRNCVQVEVIGLPDSRGPRYTQYTKGQVPEVFYAE